VMAVSFSIDFVSDTAPYDFMAEFQLWLRYKLEAELFVDHFRNYEIELLWHSVSESLPIGE
jgi:hypothetical protein